MVPGPERLTGEAYLDAVRNNEVGYMWSAKVAEILILRLETAVKELQDEVERLKHRPGCVCTYGELK